MRQMQERIMPTCRECAQKTTYRGFSSGVATSEKLGILAPCARSDVLLVFCIFKCTPILTTLYELTLSTAINHTDCGRAKNLTAPFQRQNRTFSTPPQVKNKTRLNFSIYNHIQSHIHYTSSSTTDTIVDFAVRLEGDPATHPTVIKCALFTKSNTASSFA